MSAPDDFPGHVLKSDILKYRPLAVYMPWDPCPIGQTVHHERETPAEGVGTIVGVCRDWHGVHCASCTCEISAAFYGFWLVKWSTGWLAGEETAEFPPCLVPV
jgi:hypothetical protein